MIDLPTALVYAVLAFAAGTAGGALIGLAVTVLRQRRARETFLP